MGIDEFKQNPDAKKPDATPPAEKIDPKDMLEALRISSKPEKKKLELPHIDAKE